jgi:hypothetical protein
MAWNYGEQWWGGDYHRGSWAAAGARQQSGSNSYLGGGSARSRNGSSRRRNSRGRADSSSSRQDRDGWDHRWQPDRQPERQPERRRERAPRVAWENNQWGESGSELAKATRLAEHRSHVASKAEARVEDTERRIARVKEEHAREIVKLEEEKRRHSEQAERARKNQEEAEASVRDLQTQNQEGGEEKSDDGQDDVFMWASPPEPAAQTLDQLCQAASQRSKDPATQRLLRKAATALKAKDEPAATQAAAGSPAAPQTQPDCSQDVYDMAATREANQNLKLAYAAARLLPDTEKQLEAINAAMQQFIPQACPPPEPPGGKAIGKGKAEGGTARYEPFPAAAS